MQVLASGSEGIFQRAMTKTRATWFTLVLVACSLIGEVGCFDEEFLAGFNRVMVEHRSLVLAIMGGAPKCGQIESGKWTRVTDKRICFGARNNMFGTFQVPSEGFLGGLRLSHVHGHVTCDKRVSDSYSKWGCWTEPQVGVMNVIVTTHRDEVIYPQQRYVTDNRTMWYKMPGYDPDSPEVIFEDKFKPTYVTSGQKLRLWFGEDMNGVHEKGNSGQTCAHVSAWYL